MNLLYVVDVTSLVVLYAFLLYFSMMDKEYRSLPLYGIMLFTVFSIGINVARFYFANDVVLVVSYVSFLLTGLLAFAFTLLVYLTRMIGIGDVFIILLTGISCPYIPCSGIVTSLPILTPLATIISSSLVYVELRRTTSYIDGFPPRFRRVRKHRASELKNTSIVREYPVYIDGIGFVYDRIFTSSPVENVSKILHNVPDDAVVYTIPNFPFVYYFTIGHFISLIFLLTLNSLISLI